MNDQLGLSRVYDKRIYGHSRHIEHCVNLHWCFRFFGPLGHSTRSNFHGHHNHVNWLQRRLPCTHCLPLLSVQKFQIQNNEILVL